MEIKAVVTDIDGTITDMEQNIDLEVIAALRSLEKKGIRVCIASGNVLPIAYAVSTYAGFSGPVIAENGGIVGYSKQTYQLSDPAVPNRALAHLETLMPVRRLYSDQWRLSEVALENSMDYNAVQEALEDFDICVEKTSFAIHLLNKGHNKMTGVKKAAELMGIDVSSILCFGDSDNDKEMLEGCGLGAAVANASEAARNSADYVSDKPYGSGVLDGLKKFNLI